MKHVAQVRVVHAADVTGIVLAGGMGRRMGSVDKGLVPLAGRPMVAHVLARLAPQVGAILVNANQNAERYAAFGHPVVPDELGGMGVGKALVEHMVMDVRERGLKIVPLCPFTKAMLQRHKEWQDILRDPF